MSWFKWFSRRIGEQEYNSRANFWKFPSCLLFGIVKSVGFETRHTEPGGKVWVKTVEGESCEIQRRVVLDGWLDVGYHEPKSDEVGGLLPGNKEVHVSGTWNFRVYFGMEEVVGKRLEMVHLSVLGWGPEVRVFLKDHQNKGVGASK